MTENSYRVTIGRVQRPHGVKGEIRVIPTTDFPERFFDLDTIVLTTKAGVSTQFTAERVRALGNAVGIKVTGIDTPEAVKANSGAAVEVDRNQGPELPDDTYHHADLIGLRVETDGSVLGVVEEVVRYPASDVLIVVTEQRKKHEIPFVGDVIRQVDLEAGVVHIDVLPGLLDY